MANARIQVVEDESIVALDIKDNLEILGYNVVAVESSGEQAIQKAIETRPDLVLMDIRLKGEMDGIEAAQQIRAHLGTPVIYLTAYADEATLQRAKITEPYGYILKPFEERELHTTIEMALYKHRMEKRLKESERWLATTLKSIGDAVIATDAQGCIKFMNPIAETLTGWKQREAWGKSFEEVFHIIHEKTRNQAESPVTRVFREGVTVGIGDHILLVAKNGAEVPIDDSAAPIRDGKGNLTGVVVVFRDVRDRVEAERSLRQYAVELQARNEDLNAFAHTVAHDLKAPLNPIIGFAQVLEENYASMPNEELRELLGMIVRSGRKMNNIIEELLLLAEVRKTDVNVHPLPMGRIVAEAQQRLAYMIEEKQVEVNLPDTWPLALGYSPWIEEVWANYLSNGIKYGGQPPCLSLGATTESNGMVRFWIRDNGPGLTPEERARLFTPFTQLSQVRATGHGLGLSIVQRIVEKLGGQVGVDSEVGRGSVFTFTLPRAA
jgi:PAS domain S-box-containing protein